MTAAHIAEMAWLHTATKLLYRTYHNKDQAFYKMIIDLFEDPYLGALSDEIVGYTRCTSLQLLSHLLTYYAMTTPPELKQNCECLNTPYDPSQPIKNVFQQIQDAPAFAVVGGHPYGDAMVVNVC
jgi:hypothetical protein